MGKEYIRQIMILGSVPSLGPVMLFDDMEDLFKWVETGTAGDTVFEKIATVAYNGSASLHMKSRTTFAAALDTITGSRLLFQRPGKRNRLELLFRIEVNADCKWLSLGCSTKDGTNLNIARLRYDVANTKWLYLNSASGYTDVPGGSQGLLQAGWHRVLLEWDEANAKYKRMVCDALEVDMSAIAIPQSADATPQNMQVNITLTTIGAAATEGYFDDVLVLEI